MVREAQFAIGAKATCSDESCGEVHRLIIDPATETVTHLVIQPGLRQLGARLVPVDLVESTAGEIRLRCTRAEFDRLEPAEERIAQDEGNGAGIWEVEGSNKYGNIGGAVPTVHVRTVIQDVVPLGEAQVGPDQPVHAIDGEIGRVRGFLVDPSDHRVTHVLLREGHLWEHKEVAIPVSAVTSVKVGIRLNITKQQVENLPPVNIDQPG